MRHLRYLFPFICSVIVSTAQADPDNAEREQPVNAFARSVQLREKMMNGYQDALELVYGANSAKDRHFAYDDLVGVASEIVAGVCALELTDSQDNPTDIQRRVDRNTIYFAYMSTGGTLDFLLTELAASEGTEQGMILEMIENCLGRMLEVYPLASEVRREEVLKMTALLSQALSCGSGGPELSLAVQLKLNGMLAQGRDPELWIPFLVCLETVGHAEASIVQRARQSVMEGSRTTVDLYESCSRLFSLGYTSALKRGLRGQ